MIPSRERWSGSERWGFSPVFFDTEERLRELSEAGDPLEQLLAVIDFEMFRADLDAALRRSDRRKGGRPPLDAVMMFKILVLQALYGLSDEAAEYQVRDRLSFMRFLGCVSAWKKGSDAILVQYGVSRRQ